MSKAITELVELTKKYENLKRECRKKGKRNDELNLQNQALLSENAALKALLCEKYEINTNVLSANIKLYRKEQQIKAKQAIIKQIKRRYE